MVITEVRRLETIYPGHTIKITGHSLGAGIAQLVGMALIRDGLAVHMINFGQPRVGDAAFANFANTVFPSQFRVTHN